MKLTLERLERRDLLTVLRLASWNTANGPDFVADDADFETVLEAIGNESVQGTATRVDLLALQETDLPGSGMNSIGRIESILEGLYPGIDYQAVVSSLDGGGDATGFVYDTSTLSLLNTQELASGLTHTTLRGEFRPGGTTGDADFFVYSTHLKAGTSGSDEATRAAEASLLRADADALGAGASVIVTGDLNVRDSFELGFSNFLAAGPAQLNDPINAPGNWHNNNAFRSIHTQNPQDPGLGGGGMDDRFDFQLLSGEFFDGTGIDYIDGSYRAFGNNGTHALNGAITSGTGADASVLQALANASDHLPVVVDYDILSGEAGVSIVETGEGTTVIEGGAIDTYTVGLTAVPTDTVTVTVSPDGETDLGAGPGTSVALVFTPENALTNQSIIVTANDDTFAEGTHTSTITHTVSSSDPDFDGLSLDPIVVTVRDNEAPTIVINELDSDTDGLDAGEFIELYDGGVGNASLDGHTVVLFNGSSDQSYAAFDLDGMTTDSDGFFLLGNVALNPDLTFSSNTLQNGADAAALYLADATDFPNGSPVSTSQLLDAVVYDTDDADDPGLLPLLLASQPQINEDANNQRETESVARVPDAGAPRETISYTTQIPTPRALNAPPVATVILDQSAGRTDVTEGGSIDSYTIALSSFPSANVVLTIDPDSQVDLGNGAGNSIQLTFTPTNAVIPQTVVVTAVDDPDIEGPHLGAITHSAASGDAGYDGLAIGNVLVNITDNETLPEPELVISEIMYNPDSEETEPGVAEWIEVVNAGNVSVDLNGWSFDDEDSTDWGAFPATSLEVGEVAVFFDQDFTSEATFRTAWSVPASAQVIGIEWGSLANSPSAQSEILQLLDNAGNVQDEVNYDDSGDWPSDSPDGPSITLIDVAADNNVGTNWARSEAGVAQAINPTSPFSTEDVGSPGFAARAVDGDFDDDGGYGISDVDALVAAIVFASHDPLFDLTGDGPGRPTGP